MSRITRIFGDQVSPNHRSALSGNAMSFTSDLWVKIDSGEDSMIDLIRDNRINHTLVVSFVASPPLFQTVMFAQGRALGGFSDFSNINIYGRFFNSDNFQVDYIRANGFLGESTSYVTAGNFIGKKEIISYVKRSGNFSTSTFYNTRNRRISKFYQERGPIIPISGLLSTTVNDLTIGRITVDGLNAGGSFNRFTGVIRSFEILPYDLTDSELSVVMNYGSIFAANQAGKLFISNLRDLLSIDFNRQPGEIPICRPNTRRLTVTCYNNTTVVTNPTNYVDWNSL